MSRFHLSSYVLVCLPGGFPYRFPVEIELVPVDSTTLEDAHDLPPITSPFLTCEVDSIRVPFDDGALSTSPKIGTRAPDT